MLSYEQIRERADAFLRKHHPSGVLPVPIEDNVDVTLRLDIVPIPNGIDITGSTGGSGTRSASGASRRIRAIAEVHPSNAIAA